MKALLSFDTLITPKFIKFFFYVGVVICLISGFLTFVSILSGFIARAQMFGGSQTSATVLGLFLGSLAGLIVALVGIICARVTSELTLVIFMIRDELAWQREHAVGSRPAGDERSAHV